MTEQNLNQKKNYTMLFWCYISLAISSFSSAAGAAQNWQKNLLVIAGLLLFVSAGLIIRNRRNLSRNESINGE